MTLSTNTTLIPGKTIVTDSTGGVAIDYSAELSQIVTALQRIATANENATYNLGRLVSMVAQHSTSCTGSISGTTLTVTNVNAQIYPRSEVISTPVEPNSVTPIVKPGTIITAQLTYTNTPAATTTATGTGNKLTVVTTRGIRIGQFVAGAGAGTLSTVAGSPTVTNVNPATNEVTISTSLSGTGSGTYTFTSPGRDGTYTVSISQTVALAHMVISDLSQGSLADVVQDNVFRTVDAYDISTPAKLIAELNGAGQDIALTKIFNSLPITDAAQDRVDAIQDTLTQFNKKLNK